VNRLKLVSLVDYTQSLCFDWSNSRLPLKPAQGLIGSTDKRNTQISGMPPFKTVFGSSSCVDYGIRSDWNFSIHPSRQPEGLCPPPISLSVLPAFQLHHIVVLHHLGESQLSGLPQPHDLKVYFVAQATRLSVCILKGKRLAALITVFVTNVQATAHQHLSKCACYQSYTLWEELSNQPDQQIL
jgi:hypothetical protein